MTAKLIRLGVICSFGSAIYSLTDISKKSRKKNPVTYQIGVIADLVHRADEEA